MYYFAALCWFFYIATVDEDIEVGGFVVTGCMQRAGDQQEQLVPGVNYHGYPFELARITAIQKSYTTEVRIFLCNRMK
jgi:hypothetical protein